MTGRPAAWALRTRATLDEVNLHLAALEAAGLLGIAEEPGHAAGQPGKTVVYLPDRVSGLAIEGRWEEVPDRDWGTAWRERLKPVRVGRITVSPPWLARAGDLVIEPAQAFGTGHHETTASCLAALQRVDLHARSVLDVGTGSGVLAIAAARLGAAPVVAVDTDALAVTTARDNAAANGVVVDVRHGSLDVVDARFDVVVGNLDTSTVRAIASDLVDRLTPDGTLIVSGVSLAREHEASAGLQAAGVAVTADHGNEWVVLTGHRP